MKKLLAISLFTLSSSLFIPQDCGAQVGYINTMAGNGSTGYNGDNIQATAAEFYIPGCVALDTAGNFYVCDQNNDRIRMVTVSTGIITTVAGNGTAGFSGDGGQATAAEMTDPFTIILDDSNNIYFSDYANNRVRKIVASTGIITTIAGTGVGSYNGDGIQATAANITPVQLAVDKNGNVFIADIFNNRIREVNRATGLISTVAGNGTAGFSGDGGVATAAELQYPWGLAIDDSVNLYIGDANNNCIRKVETSSGLIHTIAGNGTASYSGDGGPATAAEMNNPTGLFVDSYYNLYIADFGNQRVRMVDQPNGIINTIAGNGVINFYGDGGPATAAELDYPEAVAVDKTGNIYIVDEDNNRVRMINGSILTSVNQLPGGNGNVTVYPNPSNGVFELEIRNYELGMKYNLEVYNVLGAQVYIQFLIPNSQFLIDLSSHPYGIYLYRVIANNGELVGEGKLIIQK